VTVKEMEEVTNLSRRGVEYNLDKLKKAKKIRRKGSTKSGIWVIENDEKILPINIQSDEVFYTSIKIH
jgi:predicted HTH transcriptional regulator